MFNAKNTLTIALLDSIALASVEADIDMFPTDDSALDRVNLHAGTDWAI